MRALRLPSLSFELPRHVDVLIFDEEGSAPIKEDLTSLGLSFATIEVRGRGLSVWALIHALLRIPLSKEALFRRYLDSHVRLAKPRVMISLIDNNSEFWRLGARFPEIRSIAVQNGWRSKAFDVFDAPHNPNDGFISDLFCFNTSVGNLFTEHVSVSKVHPVGSYRSNRVPILRGSACREAVWISQFSPSLPANSRGLTPDQFMTAEIKGVQTFLRWALLRGLNAVVLGRHAGMMSEVEKGWFHKHLTGIDFTFLEKSDEPSASYKIVDQARILGTCESTLGYESLARGVPVFFFSSRPVFANLPDWRFGWPDNFQTEGPFWSSSTEASLIFSKLDALLSTTPITVSSSGSISLSQLMGRDDANITLKSLISEAVR